MNTVKTVKNRAMNRFIMVLCCLGVLSAVSCDNEHSEKIAPTLEKVNLSARQTSQEIKTFIGSGNAYTQLTITMDEKGTTPAKYYTTVTPDGTGTDLKAVNLPIGKDGSIEPLFLKATDEGTKYWVQQFDIYDKDPSSGGEVKYRENGKAEFTLKTGVGVESVPIQMVDVTQSGVKGAKTPLRGLSFSTKTVKRHSFQVGFLNSNQQWFTNSASNAPTITFKVTHGSNPAIVDYDSGANIFSDAVKTPVGSNYITITLKNSLAYYKDQTFAVTAKVKASGNSNTHTLTPLDKDADTQIRAGKLLLKVVNTYPTITNKGSDGKGSKVFNVSTDSDITVFTSTDTDSDSPNVSCKWTLYNGDIALTGSNVASITKAVIHPSTITTTNSSTLLSTQTDVSSYSLKVHVTADDGYGGIEEKDFIFTFTKS